MDRLTVTVAKAVQMLGVSPSSAYECVRTGELRALRLGRRLVVPRAALEELLAGQPVAVSVSGETETTVLSVEHGRLARSDRRRRVRRSLWSCRPVFVSGRVAVPEVVMDLHRLACSASGTSGCTGGLRWLRGQR